MEEGINQNPDVQHLSEPDFQEINQKLLLSQQAFAIYRNKSLSERAGFLSAIAHELKQVANELIEMAGQETNLPPERLKTELTRTIFQLESYGQACAEGTWLDLRIDTSDGPQPDLRKMLVPLGPVVVFGASNFPFAYSTAGGDTACALAAGCTVILKAHPAHAKTSEKVANAIQRAAQNVNLPPHVFVHIHATSFEAGHLLVSHPIVQAVGFTGSIEGGKALTAIAAARKQPIPVFAEMGSINPVFILSVLQEEPESLADKLAASIMLSEGQFCTNPGLIICIKSKQTEKFIEKLALNIRVSKPGKMLHEGIAKNFYEKRTRALEQGIELRSETETTPTYLQSQPTVAITSAAEFMGNNVLHQEVFGPFSLIVLCEDISEMIAVAKSLEGQLTATLIGTDDEAGANMELIDAIQNICGRFIMNGVPTGVRVALAMQHGGPFPATTDSRFTAVGADGIKRFCRPLCYQNWPDHLLPIELQNSNTLNLWRTVDGKLTKNAVLSGL